MSYKLPERLVYWPESKASDNMYARLVCYPPLGQTTVVPSTSTSVAFTVVVETKASSTREWEVELWHNFGDTPDWQGTSFEELGDSSDLVNLSWLMVMQIYSTSP
jgi:hypothetical protein